MLLVFFRLITWRIFCVSRFRCGVAFGRHRSGGNSWRSEVHVPVRSMAIEERGRQADLSWTDLCQPSVTAEQGQTLWARNHKRNGVISFSGGRRGGNRPLQLTCWNTVNPRINAPGVYSYNRSEPPAFIRDPAFIKSCCIGLLRKNLCSCLLVTATNWFFY